jgi:hypothetical protein
MRASVNADTTDVTTCTARAPAAEATCTSRPPIPGPAMSATDSVDCRRLFATSSRSGGTTDGRYDW